MQKIPRIILTAALAATFIWIGILILRAPEAWGGYLQPWAVRLLPVPITQLMLATAALDILIGILLLMKKTTWIAALVGAFHILVVLLTSGITDVTVRDIGLLGAALSLFMATKPSRK